MAFDPGGELTGWDLTGFHEGHDTEAWRRLGAHEVSVTDSERGQVSGTRFSVWAPNAQAVRLVGDFNYWNGESSPMHLVPGSGVWSLFIEGVGTGTLYKFEVLGADGVWRLKADPFARFCEAPPHNASIVYESQYQWDDEQWLWFRGQKKQYEEPVSIYEVHLGSWRKGLTYVELARQLVEYVTWQGFTHVEFMPVAEHPYDGSWGYHVTGYFAPISRFGSPDEFRYLVDELHKAGIGVLVDWVPGHFATDPWALQRFDGTALYEHEDPRLGWHPDWGSYIFNFGRNEVKAFLISNAFYWLEEFHIDGLRIDAVASMLYLDYSREAGQWVPNKFGGNENLEAVELLQRVNEHNYRRMPGIMMVAEESTSWPGVTRSIDHGGLGFGFKWNMGWMNDSLRYYGREPIYRQYHHHEMTFAMAYAYSENFVLPISHDEVVHGKGSMYERAPQDEWRKFGTMRAFYAFMWAHPGKKLLFMGTEFGQRREFSESRSIDWDQSSHWGHRGVQRLIKDLNGAYSSHPALFKLDNDPAGFRWINADDAGGNIFSWVRFDGDGQMIACITNFSSEPRPDYRIGLPAEGSWTEIMNTDAEVYDGTGQVGNLGEVIAHPVPSHGFSASASVTVPPLGAVWLLHQAEPTEESDEPEKVAAGTRAVAKQVSPKPSRPEGRVIRVPEGEEAAAEGEAAKAPAKKAPAKKAPSKTVAKKAPAKKSAAKKTVEKAAETAVETVKKVAEKAPAKKTATKKTAAKKTAAKKAASKKATPPTGVVTDRVQVIDGGDGTAVLTWEQGLAPDELQAAATEATEHALTHGVRRVEVAVAAADRWVRRAVLRSGFRQEGVRRAVLALPDGTFDDLVLYARLAGDLVGGPHGFSSVMNSVLPRKRLIAHVLMRHADGRILLCDTAFKTDWELPGGIVEPGEAPRDGAIREVREELGIDLAVGRLLVADWLPPYLGWDDAVEMIFDGGMVSDDQLDGFSLQENEIKRVLLVTLTAAAGLVTPLSHRRLSVAVGQSGVAGGTVYLQDGRRV